MKPLKLTLSAFGSYREKQCIDFEKIDHGLFLITGDTGAGKTTVFDALMFALFDESSGGKRDGTMMRSQFAKDEEETFVTLEFLEKGERYQVTRKPRYIRKSRRKNKDGNYTDVECKAEVRLLLPDGTEYPGTIRDVNEKLKEILGLERNQFSQVSMIAQGEYLRLLQASSRDRKEIFSRLFDTGIYGRIQQKLREDDLALRGQLEDNQKRISHELENVELPENSTSLVAWETARERELGGRGEQERLLEQIVEEQKEKERLLQEESRENRRRQGELEQFLERIRENNRLLEAYQEKKERLAELEARKEERNRQAGEAEAARRAETLREAARLRDERRREAEEIREHLKDIREEQTRTRSRQESARASLDEALAKKEATLPGLDQKMTRLQDALGRYREWGQAREKLNIARREREAAQKELDRVRRQEETGHAAFEELKSRREQLVEKGGRLPGLEAEVREAERQCRSLEKLERLLAELAEETGKLNREQRVLAGIQNTCQEAEVFYQNLYRRFLESQAGILAKDLAEGTPCPVCGSLHHPEKCPLPSEAPTQKEVEEARTRREEEETRRQTQTEAVITLRETVSRLCRQAKEQAAEYPETAGEDSSGADVEAGMDAGVKTGVNAGVDAGNVAALLEKKRQETLALHRQMQEAERARKEAEKIAGKEETARKQLEALAKDQTKQEQRLQELKVREAEERQEEQLLRGQLPYEEEQQAREALERARKEKQELEEQERSTRQHWEEAGQKARELDGTWQVETAREEKLRQQKDQEETHFAQALEAAGFTEETFHAALRSPRERALLEQAVEEWKKALLAAREAVRAAEELYRSRAGKEQGLARQNTGEAEARLKERREEESRLTAELGRTVAAKKQNLRTLDSLKKLWANREKLEEQYGLVHGLYAVANGKRSGEAGLDFQTYVQRQYFQQMIHAANRRLEKMAEGRFLLACRPLDSLGKRGEVGLDLDVYSMETGKRRDIRTLSGGESFLAALAMALGMADVIQSTAGNVRVDAMFIDEGFGSLDEDTRFRAIQILQELAGSRSMIGLISHVPELKEQIDRKLVVTRTEKGSRISWSDFSRE